MFVRFLRINAYGNATSLSTMKAKRQKATAEQANTQCTTKLSLRLQRSFRHLPIPQPFAIYVLRYVYPAGVALGDDTYGQGYSFDALFAVFSSLDAAQHLLRHRPQQPQPSATQAHYNPIIPYNTLTKQQNVWLCFHFLGPIFIMLHGDCETMF